MNTTTMWGGKGVLAVTLLALVLLTGCKSEARVSCERNAASIGADKAPCKNL